MNEGVIRVPLADDKPGGYRPHELHVTLSPDVRGTCMQVFNALQSRGEKGVAKPDDVLNWLLRNISVPPIETKSDSDEPEAPVLVTSAVE